MASASHLLLGQSPLSRNRLVILNAILAAIYFVAAKTGLTLAFVNASATAVWPPTGITLAALLLFGFKAWPGVFVGAFLANVTTAGTIATSLAIAGGNTMEGVVGAYLVNRFANGRYAFRHARDIFRFALCGALLSTTVSATVGVTSLSLGGFANWADFKAIWLTWWLGDAAGALIAAPFLLLWATGPSVSWTRARIVEGSLIMIAALAVGGLVFGGVFAFEYLTVPLLAWAAFRLGPRLTASMIVLLSVIAIIGTLDGRGPLVAVTQNDSLLLLQAFMAIMSLVFLPVAALVIERKEAEERLRQSEDRFRTLYQREHDTVEVLQRSLLPTRLPDLPGLNIASRYIPATPEPLGGDWFDILPLPDGRISLVIGDVAGRGVEAAAVMGKLRNALRAYALEGYSPKVVMERLHAAMAPGELASIVLIALDPTTWRISYVNAGHVPPLVLNGGGAVQHLVSKGLPLGTPLQRSYEERTATFVPPCTLLLYTDGLIETRQEGIQGRLRRLEEAAASLPRDDLESFLSRLIDEIFNGTSPIDDVALLAVSPAVLDPCRFRLELPAEPASLATLRGALRQWLPLTGASEDVASGIIVAVGEAATNAIVHAYGPAHERFLVEATADHQGIRIAISDRGRWRAPRGTGGGRGCEIMRALMDSVDITPGADGTTVTLYRSLHAEAPSA